MSQKELFLNNCIKGIEYIKRLKNLNDRECFCNYFNQDEDILENLIINLDLEVKNQNETLETGHLIISLDVAEKIIIKERDFANLLNIENKKSHLH